MVLKPQTERTVKLLTGIATTWVGFHSVFRTEYTNHDENRPHVFSDIQRWYNDKFDEFVGVRKTGEERPLITDNKNIAAPAAGVFVPPRKGGGA